MNGRMLSAGFICGLALAGSLTSGAQNPVAAPVAVIEAKSRAVLEPDSIQLQLMLTAPAAANQRAVAWLLSPLGTPSGETATDLREGSRSANLTLPWPKDAHGKLVDQIGWYRFGYRIEAAGAPSQSGILSVGAIASNLLELGMASSQSLVPGMPLSVRIYAGNPITREPFRGVEIDAKLTIDADEAGKPAKATIVRKALTNRSGEAIVSFPIPQGPGQTATLKVSGTLNGIPGLGAKMARATAAVSTDFESSDRTVIRIETDKPLHKPGETVHMRALVFDGTGHAAAKTALTLTIADPDNKKLLEVPLTTNRFGIAAYDWKIGSQLTPGDYEASVEIDSSSDYEGSASSTIRIQRYELPEFSVSATMDRGYYLEGQVPLVRIRAGYLFGKPVAAGPVRIVRATNGAWNSRAGKYEESGGSEQTATLDANGDAELHLDVKSDFDDFTSKDYERYTDLQYRAIVTDASTGRSEPRNFTVRLSREPVHIYLDAEGGNDREGDYIVSTSYADGAPVAAKVTLDWMSGDSRAKRAVTVTTNRYGLAKVHLRYPALEQGKDSYGIRLIAHDPEGRISKLDDQINPLDSKQIWISVAHSLLKPDQAIEAVVHGPTGSSIDVDVVAAAGQLQHYQVRMGTSAMPLNISAGPEFHGLVTLRAYVMNGDSSTLR